jgi:hypothetical protein
MKLSDCSGLRRLILLIACLIPFVASGEGSLFFADLEPLLKQEPGLWTSLRKAFDIENVGLAPRIGFKTSPALDGMRISPYTFDAKVKGAKGPFVYAIEIRAKTVFYDANGKRCSLARATSLKEYFDSVVIRRRPRSEL